MPEMNHVIKEIEKKKNLEYNLPKYLNGMMSTYYRYSHIRLALNYYTCYEIFEEEEEKSEEMQVLVTRVNEIVLKNLLNKSLEGAPEDAVKTIDGVRTAIIETMKVLTNYTDLLQIYEYVLNRVEYRFNGREFPQQYSDMAFAQNLLEYIVSDRDNVVINGKISEVIGQLPLRMGRQKYFEIVKNSFSLYQGAERSTLQDFVYMLRTSAGLEKPEKGRIRFELLHTVYKRFQQADFENMTQKEYEAHADALHMAAAYISKMTNFYLMLQEVVNDIYVILLSMPYAIADVDELENCRRIIKSVYEQHALRGMGTLEDEMPDAFAALEGKQERLFEQISSHDFLIDTMEEHKALMESLMLDKIYLSLKRIVMLSSNSLFIELDLKKDTAPADKEDIEAACSSFIEEMLASFRTNEKLVNRSRMAATLQALPLFFSNLEELKEYILQSLDNCSNQCEKLAAIELMQKIMDQPV